MKLLWNTFRSKLSKIENSGPNIFFKSLANLARKSIDFDLNFEFSTFWQNLLLLKAFKDYYVWAGAFLSELPKCWKSNSFSPCIHEIGLSQFLCSPLLVESYGQKIYPPMTPRAHVWGLLSKKRAPILGFCSDAFAYEKSTEIGSWNARVAKFFPNFEILILPLCSKF